MKYIEVIVMISLGSFQLPNNKIFMFISEIISRLREILYTNFSIVLFLLGTASALKGFNLHISLYNSYFYYTDYRFGFILRGLVGQLFSPVLAILPQSAHADLLIAWHFAAFAVLLALLSQFAARTVAATGRADVLAMAVLLFCSPLIPSLAFFTAAPEVLLCLLTLGLVAAVRAQRFGLAWLVFLVGALAHQLMVFLALPVMVLGSLIHADRPVPAVAGCMAVGLAACLIILSAPAPDPRLIGRFIEQGITPSRARDLYELQLGQTSAEMLGVMAGLWRQNFVTGAIAVTYAALAGAVILAGCLLSPGAIRPAVVSLAFLPSGRLKAISAALLVLGAGLSPLLVLAFAWDLSRLAVLSTFTAFLAAAMLLRRAPDPVPSSRFRLIIFACGALAAVFFCLPFIGLWFTGYHLNTWKPLIRDPILEIGAVRTVVEDFLEIYGGDR
jgi:hypothetical protein